MSESISARSKLDRNVRALAVRGEGGVLELRKAETRFGVVGQAERFLWHPVPAPVQFPVGVDVVIGGVRVRSCPYQIDAHGLLPVPGALH